MRATGTRAMRTRAAPVAGALALTLLLAGTALAGWPNNPYADIVVCDAAGDQYLPTAAPDGAGGAFVAWLDERTPNADRVFIQRLSADGRPLWAPGGLALSVEGTSIAAIAMTADGAGGAIVAWSSWTPAAGRDIRAQRVRADGTFAWARVGVVVSSTDGQFGMRIVADGAGGAVIAWQDYRTSVRQSFVQRLAANGDCLWAPNGLFLHAEANGNVPAALAVTGDGGVVAAWAANEGSPFALKAQKVSGDGAILWPSGGLVAATSTVPLQIPAIASDGAQGAIVAWTTFQDFPVSRYDVKVQRVTAAGDRPWASDGLLVAGCPSALPLQNVDIASDGAGGAFLAWNQRQGADNDVQAQRISAAGASLWPGSGMAIGALGNADGPRIVADGCGGAIVALVAQQTWLKPELYAQRLSADGDAQWSLHGAAVGLGRVIWFNGAVAADGQGGVVLAWADYNDGDYNVFAQVIDGGGTRFRSGPLLTSVRDVPNDHGGRVRLSWEPSNLDRPQAGFAMYGIWRRVTESAAVAHSAKATAGPVRAQPGVFRTTDGAGGVTWWEGVDAIVADAQPTYAFEVATFADSCAATPAREVFMVDYHAAAWGAFWSSPPDSGSSVDNVSPAGAPSVRPAVPRLEQARPNPFNPRTCLAFTLPREAMARLVVFDLSGRVVRILIDAPLAAGRHEVVWDGCDARGCAVASGGYVARLDAAGVTCTSRLELVR